MAVVPGSDVLAALRAATAERHSVVDRSMPLSRPNPTMADYIDHLRLMRAWLQPLEGWLATSDVYPERHSPQILQTSLIDADLAESGLQCEPEQRGMSACGRPADADISYQWGARYVIEGSRLGAAVLYRRLAHALRPHSLHYLQGGTEASKNRWPQFLHELRATVRAPSEIEAACEGACDSFDALIAVRTSEGSFVPQARDYS
jgi:heme oxygenase